MAVSRPVDGVLGMGSTQESLFGAQRLTREEAIAKYMTPLPRSQQDLSAGLAPERIYRLGSAGQTIVFRPTTPFMNHQLRETYDPEHFLTIGRELADFGQLQECGVALFTGRKALEAYIKDSNEFYETDVDWHDIPEHRLGGHLVTIYGHNRQLGAAAINLAANGHPDRGLNLRAHLQVDLEFRHFLRMQAIENTGQSPPAWNRARSISRYLELSARAGDAPSWAELAEYYGVNVDQIWRALNYVKLPPRVMELVETDRLPYSGAIELVRLSGLYAVQDLVELAEEFATDKLSSGKIDQEVSKRVIVKGLPAEIQALVESHHISSKQAELVSQLYDYGVGNKEIEDFVVWIITEEPSMNVIREVVASRRRDIRNGQLSVFTQQGLTTETQVAEQERVRSSTRRMQIGSTVTSITRQIDALATLLKTGLAGGAIADRPIASKLQEINGYFEGGVERLLATRAVDVEALEQLREASDKLNGNLPPALRSRIDEVVLRLDELLASEAASNPAQQAELLDRIKQRISTSGERNVQTPLF